MASPNVDIRKLKDQASEYLGKSKYDKAAEILESLVRAEPKDMSHRLKLGDTYRRLGSPEKAISCYQIAGRHFGDESQLIKAIAAFKVILEIDPQNTGAQRDLAEMNNRRFAKPTLEVAGLKAPVGIGAGARGISELELADSEKAAAAIGDNIGSMLHDGRGEFEADGGADGEEPLELDLPGAQTKKRPPLPAKPSPKPAPARAATPAGMGPPPAIIGSMGQPLTPKGELEGRRGPAPKIRPSIELGGDGTELDLDLEVPQIGMDELEPLEEGAPAPSVPSTAWKSGPLPSKRAPVVPPLPAGQSAPAAVQPLAAKPAAAPVKPSIADEIEIDGADELVASASELANDEDLVELDAADLSPLPPSSPGLPQGAQASAAVARPIADLLAESEEIELISISSDDELPPPPAAKPAAQAKPATASSPGAPTEAPPPDRRAPEAATKEELDAAFDAVHPVPPKPPRKQAKVPLFDDLPQQAFLELVNRLTYKRWEQGEMILREGDPGRSFFVIVEGKVRVFKRLADGKEITLATLGEGAFFGEMALLSGAPRTANVIADQETELLEISDQLLREIVGKYPSVAQSLKNFYRQRLVNNVMAISPLFKEFEPGERRGIVERFRMKQAGSGEVFIREGQDADGLYVVLHGTAKVEKKLPDGKDFELARLKEGELFGEMSLLTSAPATATVTAAGPVILLKLPSEQFQELILTHPQILELVSDLTDRRAAQIAQVLSGHGPGHDGMSFV